MCVFIGASICVCICALTFVLCFLKKPNHVEIVEINHSFIKIVGPIFEELFGLYGLKSMPVFSPREPRQTGKALSPHSPKPEIPMAATAMEHDGGGVDVVTPGELLGASSSLVAGRGAYADGHSVRASVTGRRRLVAPAPDSSDQVGFS
jgi:hypothetical protein